MITASLVIADTRVPKGAKSSAVVGAQTAKPSQEQQIPPQAVQRSSSSTSSTYRASISRSTRSASHSASNSASRPSTSSRTSRPASAFASISVFAASPITQRQPPYKDATPTPQSPKSSRTTDPALAIESLLSKSRLSVSSPAANPPTLLDIGENEWTGNFVAGDEFLSSLFEEGFQIAPLSPRGTVYDRESKFPPPQSRGSTSSSSAKALATPLATPLTTPLATPTEKPSLSLEEQRPTSRGLRRPRLGSYPAVSPSSASPPRGLGITSWLSERGSPKAWSRNVERAAEKLTVGSGSGNMPSPTELRSQTVQDINIAVIGTPGVGKTTFIERAFDLGQSPNHGEIHTLDVTVDKVPCSVGLVEMDLNSICFEKQQVQWPRVKDGRGIPFIDGVLFLYDAADAMSMARLGESLDAFEKNQIPVCLVTTKNDLPDRTHSGVCISGYEQISTSIQAHDSQKKSVAAILSMIARRNEKGPRSQYLNGRRRANSSAANSQMTSPRPSTAGHNRASSEFSPTCLKDGSDTSSIHGTRLQRASVSNAAAVGYSSGNPRDPSSSANPLLSGTPRKNSIATQAPQITLGESGQTPFLEIEATNHFTMQPPPPGRTSSQSSLGSEQRHSYIDSDDDSANFRDPEDIPILDREDGLDDLDEEEKHIPNRGWTWDELINRLLSQPMSRADQNFVLIFLCFYRKFAAPRELLDAIVERFQAIAADEKVRVHRLSSQLRICNVLHQWVTSHPGDFAYPNTRRELFTFLSTLSNDRSFSLLTAEMAKALENSFEDEDEVWGRVDYDIDRKSSFQSLATCSTDRKPWHPADRDSYGNGNTLKVPPNTADRRSSEVSSDIGSAMGLTISRTEPLPPPTLLPGGQYDLFMAIPVQDVANELTRLDWAEFSKIRPRDLVRHISVSPENRENSQNLACVNNMISHFNHVAYWVASVILEKAKPKHRARALEKFMEISWTLRHQNNYNSLGAIIAGINGTAVHRLSQTREIVKPEIVKNFMRLELLMGTSKGHSKYRLAWDNTNSERIPFLPLHRRDLVSAEEGNKTWLQDGDKINWNKFQVMGDVMMVLIRSQETPYQEKMLSGNGTIEAMIKNAAAGMNDDDLYERSVQLEAGSTNRAQQRRWWPRS